MGIKQYIGGLVCVSILNGCASFKTLDTELPLNQRLFVYSGTSLDWAVITDNKPALSKIKVEPPAYPLIDLPFSIALDTLFLPLALVTVIFQ